MKNLFGFGPAASDGFALVREVGRGRRHGRAQAARTARKRLEFLALIEGVTPEQMLRRLVIEADLRTSGVQKRWAGGGLQRRWT